MLISEVIEMAKDAELQQLAVKDNETAIIGFINLGILELHKRFELIKRYANINLVEGTNHYYIKENSPNVTVDLSTVDIILIEAIKDADNNSLIFNDTSYTDSLFAFEHSTLQVPDSIIATHDYLNARFRATPKFVSDDSDVVPLPPQFLEPLLHYVGYRGHSSLRGAKDFENNTHYMRFDKSCNLISAEGLYTQDALYSNKFVARGFV